jgi:hypothetical protein
LAAAASAPIGHLRPKQEAVMARNRRRHRNASRPPRFDINAPSSSRSKLPPNPRAAILAKAGGKERATPALPTIFKPQGEEAENGPDIPEFDPEDEHPPEPIDPVEEAMRLRAEARLRAHRDRIGNLQPGLPAFYRNRSGVRVAEIRLTEPTRFGQTKLQGHSDMEVARVLDGVRKKLSDPMLLSGPGTIDAIDELAAALHKYAPHLRTLSQTVRESASQHIRNGAVWFQIKPILVVGPPGSGKSHFARSLARRTGLPCKVLDGTSMTSPVPLIGLDGSWKNGRISEVGLLIVESRVPNPILILDEVDKIETLGSGRAGSVGESLLGLLEPTTARVFPDSYLRQSVDLSRVNWIMTANSLQHVSAPVRDRCIVVTVEAMSIQDLAMFAAREIERRDLDPDLLPFLLGPLRLGKAMSLRRLGRMLDAAEAARDRPLLN